MSSQAQWPFEVRKTSGWPRLSWGTPRHWQGCHHLTHSVERSLPPPSLMTAVLTGVRCSLLLAKEGEGFFMYLAAISISSFENCQSADWMLWGRLLVFKFLNSLCFLMSLLCQMRRWWTVLRFCGLSLHVVAVVLCCAVLSFHVLPRAQQLISGSSVQCLSHISFVFSASLDPVLEVALLLSPQGYLLNWIFLGGENLCYLRDGPNLQWFNSTVSTVFWLQSCKSITLIETVLWILNFNCLH